MKKVLDFKNGEILINTNTDKVVRKSYSIKEETVEQVKKIAEMLNCSESKAVEQSMKVVTKLIKEKEEKKKDESISVVKGKKYTPEEYSQLSRRFDEWDNDICKGYMILAMKQAGFKREDVQKALESLRWVFYETPLELAREEYNEWYFKNEQF